MSIAVIAAVAAAYGVVAGGSPRPWRVETSGAAARAPAVGPSLCPPGTLPDDGVCIPAPLPGARRATARRTDAVPRRPDRPVEYTRYTLPVEHVTSIEDPLGRAPGDAGMPVSGIGIATEAGAAVSAVTLERQEGPARVAFTGRLFGPTVITVHTVATGAAPDEYLVVTAALGSLRPLGVGDPVAAGAELGRAGSSPLVFDTRLVRRGVDLRALTPAALLDDATSVPTDPRNVLSRGP
jgi:hypothetical protein